MNTAPRIAENGFIQEIDDMSDEIMTDRENEKNTTREILRKELRILEQYKSV